MAVDKRCPGNIFTRLYMVVNVYKFLFVAPHESYSNLLHKMLRNCRPHQNATSTMLLISRQRFKLKLR